MITIDKVTYRNLQEQVQKNKNDIEAWTNIQFTLNNMGITVLGRVDASVDIPDKSYEYGDAYLVGTSDPYDIYIYTRTTDPNVHGTFINLGPLSIAGPQGPKGDQGKDGVDGYAPVVRYGNGLPIVEATDKNGYLYIDQQTSKLYAYNNGWNYVIDMKGQQGPQGIQGAQGATGTTLSIVAKLSSPSLLPTDFSSGQIPKNSAYLVDVNGVNHLYIIIGDQNDYSTWYWLDVGDFNLGSVIYKNEIFQSSINVTDNYNTNTGAVVTDTATNSLYNDLYSEIGTIQSNVSNEINLLKWIVDTTSASPITLINNKSFRLGTITTLTINNASSYDLDFMCEVVFVAGASISIDYSALSLTFSGDDVENNVFVPQANKTYNILFFNNSNNNTASLQAIVRGV